MTPDAVLKPSDQAVAREVSGELVLMHLGSGTYFGLNDVGARFWALIAEDARSLEELAAALSENFDAPTEVILEDICKLADDLLGHDLVAPAAR